MRPHGKSNGSRHSAGSQYLRILNGPRRNPDQQRDFHCRPQPRGFRGHARAELRSPVAPGRHRHQGQDRRHRKRLRGGGCGAEDRGPGAAQGIRHAGRARRRQGGRRGRGLSGAGGKCPGRSRPVPRQGAARRKLDQAGKGLQRSGAGDRGDFRPGQGRLHRRSGRRGGLPAGKPGRCPPHPRCRRR